ncbi:tetratricopeptide repeat protein [Halarcobacter bivalviorum]|uniref:Ancillary SecYEG translocon subunit/Cell division coordinator CpoB TPR domain-containing protein n=1 Tax=Halarcobacter bivalviorum TaxID=663364 RepID=A0AAX2A9L2_9BACT|nr:tetratricopeptide repeat protein [Halarcobacter bivalviorum]AXH13260.1 hypothetical protein ABIV_2285 [Halarcobacter bivalviorum]RXK10135.1 hypothetical protein CRV05_07075 [Halarcobacter bivalviorum]
MSLKENVDYVKNELSSEEKFLESFVKIERFYKKYKMIIILLVIVIIGLVIGIFATKQIQASNKLEANIAFNKVMENPKDTEAQNILKDKSLQLYEVALYAQALEDGKFNDTKLKYFKELVAYQKALEENSIEKLNTVSMEKDFLLKEFAIFNKALLQAKEGKFEDAKATLKLIPADSQVNDLVTALNHYLVTK